MKVAFEGGFTSDDVTEWFEGNVKPTRKGVYEVQGILFTSETYWSKWNGTRWLEICTSHGLARISKHIASTQTRIWRGLKCPMM